MTSDSYPNRYPGTDRGDSARMAHFVTLDREQQAQAIARLAAAGMTDHGISAATRLSVEQVRRVLGEVSRA